jgi:HTH-type transcriptional regulator/antitoxin MqsA
MTRMCTGCDSTEGLVRFENEAFAVEHAGMAAAIEGLSGWRCPACGEVEFL